MRDAASVDEEKIEANTKRKIHHNCKRNQYLRFEMRNIRKKKKRKSIFRIQ